MGGQQPVYRKIRANAHGFPSEQRTGYIFNTVRLDDCTGCRKGTSADAIEQTVQAALASAKLPWQAICGAASIDIKQNEPGLLLFCEKHRLPFRTFTAEQLQDAQGEFSRSAFVQQTVCCKARNGFRRRS